MEKNTRRDATRTPSLRSIEKVCDFFPGIFRILFTFDKAEQQVVRRNELIQNINSLTDEEIAVIESVVRLIMRSR